MQNPPYRVKNLHDHGLVKLTAREIRGINRPTIGTRVHPGVRYIPVREHGGVDNGHRFTAEQYNASLLARIQETRGRGRVRFLWENESGQIVSTEAVRIKEYTWDELHQFVRPEGKNLLPSSALQAIAGGTADYIHEPEQVRLAFIVWES
jgi:hypothetical protein